MRRSLFLPLTFALAFAAVGVHGQAQEDELEEDSPPKPVAGVYTTYFKWSTVEFEYPNETIRKKQEAKIDQKGLLISATKIYKNRMFLSTPRYLNYTIPVTFSSVPYGTDLYTHNESPKLKPFPNYAMQEVGNCAAFQLVESMEVDNTGRLWVVDPGATNLMLPEPLCLCPAKIVVFDLNNEDKQLFTYTFPNDVVNARNNALKDISVACPGKLTDDCWVYISDLLGNRLVIYDVKNNQSWTAFHPTMLPGDKTQFKIGDTSVNTPFGITGQGLAPRSEKFDTLYYSSISRDHLFAVNTSLLQNPKLKENNKLQDSDVRDLGATKGQSDGMAMDNKGNLYYGSVTAYAVYKTKLTAKSTKVGDSTEIAQSDREISWPDTFAFDNKGNVAFTTTTFHKYADGTLTVDQANPRYRVIRFYTGTNAYSF